jgi:hypothetical protein
MFQSLFKVDRFTCQPLVALEEADGLPGLSLQIGRGFGLKVQHKEITT